MEFDLVVCNGTVVTASDIWESCDIGIKDGTIVAIGPRLPAAPGAQEIDAEGAFITPGGVDAHVHLSQVNIDHSIVTNGVVPDPENFVGDTFTTGTRSAVAGGTTAVITFASPMRKDESIIAVIEDYHKLAKDQSYCDYAFHVIITNPMPQIVEDEFPRMVDEHGITSVKLYMTYKPLRLLDYQILDVMYSARKLGITTMVHAENADVIDWSSRLTLRSLSSENLFAACSWSGIIPTLVPHCFTERRHPGVPVQLIVS
ncbi:Metallo-dependent hydrolase [Suillus decipiens]|nr:Metallo-dependent hydrolase [Suillus decipiens]